MCPFRNAVFINVGESLDSSKISGQSRGEIDDRDKKKYIEEFKKVENPTVETRAGFIRYLRTTYPDMPIPEDGYNIVYGYKDDDAMRQILESKRAANGGFIVEKDLLNLLLNLNEFIPML